MEPQKENLEELDLGSDFFLNEEPTEDDPNYIEKYRMPIQELGFSELGKEDSVCTYDSENEKGEPIIRSYKKYDWHRYRNFAFYPVKGEPKHFLIEVKSKIPMIRLTLQECSSVDGRKPLEYWGIFDRTVIERIIYLHDIF